MTLNDTTSMYGSEYGLSLETDGFIGSYSNVWFLLLLLLSAYT